MKEGDFKLRWSQFVESKQGRRVIRGTQVLFALGIVAYLIYELQGVSWTEIRAALPVHPLFYVLLLMLYFLVPLAELCVYRITWAFDAWRSVPAFLKKRIYNTDVLGYSGEFYFYTWARKHVGLSDREILKTIRDQNVVSSAASTMIAVVLVAIFSYTGQINVIEWIGQQETAYLVGGAVVAVLLAVLLAGIHHGLTEKMDPGPIWSGSACEEVDEDIPFDLTSALARLRASAVLKSYLGDSYVELYCATKEAELASFLDHVTPREYQWYL